MSNDLARQIAASARQFQDPAERAEYLDRVCRGIARLRADVEAHLALPESGTDAEPETRDERETSRSHATAARPQETAADALSSAADPGIEKAGDRIGRYRLVQELGEGGFGTVWKAQQVEPVTRDVALKIIKLGMDTGQVVARFEQERQALALMDHPNVARVIDAGATSRGRPYFVMDLVQGVPIGEFCDAERLAVDARLDLFVQVCAAVQHAHMKGIIHRDLKPSNILVANRDGKPHATVIDFGIAKATSSKLTDRSLVTEAYQVIGTLQYMSPEQSQASPDIDTRTDVYSLGVILYEMLAGTTPYDAGTFQRAVFADILRMIGEVDPPPPSAKVTEAREALPAIAEARSVDVRRLSAVLRGDLDWIVLRAIEKDRDRRYESAEAFAADIRRYRSGEPVTAAPPSASYRMRKLVRRNKGKVAAAAAVAASLVAGIVAFAWQAGVARQERDDAVAARKTAEVERTRAESVAGFMESVFDGIDPDQKSSGSGTLKDQLLARLDRASGEFERLEADPLGRAQLAVALARPLYALGEYGKAERLYREAWELRARHLGASAPLSEEAELLLAGVYRFDARLDDALAVVERVRERRRANGTLTGDAADEIDLALAETHDAAGRHDAAIPLYEALRDRAAAAGGPDTQSRLFRLHGLGAAYRRAGRTGEAITVLQDVLARRTAMFGEDDAETMLTANSLAVAYTTMKRYDEALPILESVHRSFSRRYAPDHPYVLHARMNIAGLLDDAGRLAEALPIAEDVAARVLARYGPEAMDTVQIRYGLARIYSKAERHAEEAAVFEAILGPMHRIWGVSDSIASGARDQYFRACGSIAQPARAVKFISGEAARLASDPAAGGADGDQALHLCLDIARWRIDLGETEAVAADVLALAARTEKALGADHVHALAAMHEAGRLELARGAGDAAIAWFRRAHAGRAAKLGPDHADTIRSAHLLGAAFWRAGAHAEAVNVLEDTLRRAERALGRRNAETISTACDLAVNLIAVGRKEAYVELLAAWLPLAQTEFGMNDPNVAGAVDDFVRTCSELDRIDLVAPVLDLAADAASAASSRDHPDVLHLRGIAATGWFKAGRLDKSVPAFTDLLARSRRVLGPDHTQTLVLCANLAVNLSEAGRAEEALPHFEDTLRRVRSADPEARSVLAFAETEYTKALARVGRTAEVKARVDESVAAARKSQPANSLALASEFGTIIQALLDAKLYAEAEPLLREMVAIREKAAPDAWNHHNARALVGEALLGQGRFAEAEPFVVSGCEGVVAREASMSGSARHWVAKARERVLRLYAAWDAAEPGKGHDAALAAWKEKLGAGAAGTK